MRPNIAIHGKIAAGKSTVADCLVDIGYTRASLAIPLKILACMARDVAKASDAKSRSKTRDDLLAFAHEVSPAIDYDILLTECATHAGDLCSLEKPRLFLQHVGTDLFRAIDPDCWVRWFLKQVASLESEWVCDDMRFRNEAEAFRAAGVKLVTCWLPEVQRRARVGRLYGDVTGAGHASEHDLDDWTEWDATVNTGVPMEQQAEVVAAMLREKGWEA